MDGQRYGTFSDNLGEYAQECATNETPVKIAVEQSGTFQNVVGIWPQETTEEAEPEEQPEVHGDAYEEPLPL